MFKDIYEYIQFPLQERRAHLNLDEACIEIGGTSQEFRGTLSHYLKTTIPKGMKIHLCHACGNQKCSNPKHLYWGTPKENFNDAVACGKSLPISEYLKRSKAFGGFESC